MHPDHIDRLRTLHNHLVQASQLIAELLLV